MLPSQPIRHGPERSSTAAVWGGVAACALRVGHNASARRLLPTPCFCPQLPRLVPKRLADRSEGDYDAPEEAAEDDRCVFAARAAAGRRGPGGVSGTESSSTPGLTHTPSLLPNGARTGRVGRVVSDCISLFIFYSTANLSFNAEDNKDLYNKETKRDSTSPRVRPSLYRQGDNPCAMCNRFHERGYII